MIPDGRVSPMKPIGFKPDPFPFVELSCGFLSVRTLAECERSRCPWVYTRLREENRIKDDAVREKDAKAKEGMKDHG